LPSKTSALRLVTKLVEPTETKVPPIVKLPNVCGPVQVLVDPKFREKVLLFKVKPSPAA
jgi:hypothetical protein